MHISPVIMFCDMQAQITSVPLDVQGQGNFYAPRRLLPLCPSVHRPSVTLLSGEISKNIEGNLMKFDTLIEGHKKNCRMQEP